MSIYAKILKVQKEAETIPKSGYNSFNKYAYSTEADVLAVKDLMNRHGLIAYPDTVAYETFNRGDNIQVIQHIEYTVVDVDNGESIKVKVLGQGEDKGDKGAYKASTGANKYFYLKFAGCASGDDPERDEQSGKASTKKTTKATEAKTPTPSEQQASKIYELAKRHKLEPTEVLQACGVSSIKGLAEANDIQALKEAYDRLDFYVKENKAS